MYYIINADGEGYLSDTPDVPAGYQVFAMSEEQGLIPYSPPAPIASPAPAPVQAAPLAAIPAPAPVATPVAPAPAPEPAPVNNPIYDNLYVVNAEGEGYQYSAETGALPEGSQLYSMSEEQGLTPVDNRLATDANIQYGAPGSLGYELATLGGMGTSGGFDSAGFTNPDAVAAFLEPYIPQGADLTPAIQDAWQQQQSQFGGWSGADDPGQTALKILEQVDAPWANYAQQAIQYSPEFAQSQAAGTAALAYDPDAGSILGVPGPIAAAALGMALGPMGLNLNALLGGGILGGAGTGAISSAIMGGDPLMGALSGGVAPGLGELGLPAAYIPAASSLINSAINGGDLSSALMGAASGTLNYMAQDNASPSVFDETDAGMAEAYANPYPPPELFQISPTEPLPSFTATVVPDAPQMPAAPEPVSQPTYPQGQADFPIYQPPVQQFPQEQADFPIYQPQDMTGFQTPDSPITQAAMGNYTPDPAYDFQQPPMVETAVQNNGLILPDYTVNLADSSTQIPATTDMTGFYTPPSAMEQAVMGQPQQQETPTDGGSMDMTGFYTPDFMDGSMNTEQVLQSILGDAYQPLYQDFSGAQQNTGYDWTGGMNTVNLANSGQTMPTNPIPGMSDALWNQVSGAYTGTGGTGAGTNVGGVLGLLKQFLGASAGQGGGSSNPLAGLMGGNSSALTPILGMLAGGLLGGMSGNSKPAGNTTVTQDVPDWQKPYITGMLDSAKNVYQAAENNNGFLTNGRNTLNSAISGDFLNSNPANAAYGAAAGYNNPYEGLLAPTATGAFLNANPYLDATYDKAARSMTDQYKYATMPGLSRQFGHMQAFGGNSGFNQAQGLAQQNLATGLGDLATGIYGNNYANERGMMQNAQTGLLGSANTTQGVRLSGASGLGQNFNTARSQQLSAATTAPGYANDMTSNIFGPINNYSNLVGKSFGSQTQQPYFSNQAGGALSGALGGLALSNLFKG